MYDDDETQIERESQAGSVECEKCDGHIFDLYVRRNMNSKR